MTNELGTTLADIEEEISRRKFVLRRLEVASDLLQNIDGPVNTIVLSAIKGACEYIENRKSNI